MEDVLISHLPAFLLELGKEVESVTRQQRISTGSRDFYSDWNAARTPGSPMRGASEMPYALLATGVR